MFLVASNGSVRSAGLAISVDTPPNFSAAAKAWRQLHKALFDTYRPELHYMRGPGPKCREKHVALQAIRPGGLVICLPVELPSSQKNDVPRPDEGECCVRELTCRRVRNVDEIQRKIQRRLPRSIRLRLILDK